MAISLSISAKQNSQNIENNTSNVTVTVSYSWSGGSYNHSGAWLEITLNGTSDGGSVVKLNPSKTTSGSDTLGTFTLNIPHNEDGKKTVYFSAYCETGISSGTVEASGSKVLTQIPRAGSITAAPNFTDEGNPKITYSNPAGSSAKVEACISLDGSKDDIAYRTVSSTGSSYTFNLTTTERNILRKATTNSNSRNVRFYIRTTIGSNEYLSYLTKTLTIVNANPTISPTIKDTNSKTIALTGDSNKLVRYYSNAAVTIGATAIKSATLKSLKVVNGSKSLTTNGTINAIDSGTFKFTATDSRGNSTTKTVTPTTVNYIKLTCNIGGNTPDTQGNFAFTVKGNYFNGSFGAVANTLQVYYRWKQDGDYTEWTAMDATKSGNTYTAVANLTGLDYQTIYTFQAYAVDKLATIYTDEKPIKSKPIFDWGANEFAFHVPVIMDNAKQLYFKSTDDTDVMMVSLNNLDQSFFGYGGYNQDRGSTYFDGNSVYIRSKTNINNSATGTIGGNKAWTSSSDNRLKTNIENIPAVFAEIWLDLQPKVFEWNELNNNDNKKHFGLIAQDAIEVFKKYGVDYKSLGFIETIPINDIDYLAITYDDYHMITAKVLKDTVSKLTAIENEVAQLKAMMEV